MRFLIIEDDLEIASIVQESLAELGAIVECEMNGRKALARTLDVHYDVIILDLKIPGLDGFTFIKLFRERDCDTPILIISGLNDLEDRLRGFDVGADDYLCKPFALPELQLRIKNILKRNYTVKNASLHFKNIELNRVTRKASRHGHPILLKEKEFMLLELFMSSPNLIVSREMILKRVWHYDFDPQTNIVNVLVCRLRSKLSHKSDKAELIHTIRGVGFILK
ncbi:response regulator transcription factor [Bdellovibrio sp. HCB-110]|uniref:response regulator transcription factor n=1 Tax=Bdellovibrio sp. HCB-110 TaxID=3391182 RepID=UPI0039B5BC91